MSNPASMCFGNKSKNISFIDSPFSVVNYYNLSPEGGKCEGYPNSDDGVYFNRAGITDLPDYTTDNYELRRFSLPQKFTSSSDVFKVILIKDEFFVATFYFANINGYWYIICQDFCDCSI